jgi:aminotransferase
MTTGAPRPPLAQRALAERVNAVPPSGIRRFFDILATMDDVISLGVGEPDFDTPERIVAAGVRSLHNGRTHYTSNYGTIELRRALADHLERRYSVAYDPATELLITVGASEAVDLALRATCDPGDEVILHEPSYVAYVPAIVFAGGVVRTVATRLEDDFALDPAAVEAAVTPRTKALFLGHPCNPTGAVLPDDVQEQLADIARRHDLLVYSDEIYDRLAYGSYRHRPFSALPGMRDRTILMGGFSKAYAMTGWRVGWLAAPAGILEGIVKVHQYGIMSAGTTAQDAALEALLNGEADVERMVAEYDRRRRLVVDGLNAIGLRTFEPRGAFYAFPEVTSATGLSSEDFAQGLLQEERVAVVPGSAFGSSGEGHVRACYATSYEQLEEALARIGRFVERRRSASRSAVDRWQVELPRLGPDRDDAADQEERQPAHEHGRPRPLNVRQ